ncbi:hypothetical protein BECAL_01764 [Bellilinea caldifistulae]|nr:hypothetical protein [Bellilinea caldifistulae]GAP10591.1 hypothetical protein BECAL_01764 [Bellilinea caldifistulae]
MTTMTMSNSKTLSPYPIVLTLIVITMAVLSYHAIAKHGSAAYAASQCADSPEVRMINPMNGRVAYICWTERGWGVYIQAPDGTNVTAFVKEKLKKLADVIRYMRNTGYELLQ